MLFRCTFRKAWPILPLIIHKVTARWYRGMQVKASERFQLSLCKTGCLNTAGACYVDCQYLLEYTPFLSSESSKSYCLSLLFVVNRHTILIRSMGVTHSRSRNDYCYKAPFAFNPVLYETHAFIASQVLFCHFRMAERHFRSLRAIQYDAFMD
jgi:hypothetical protein